MNGIGKVENLLAAAKAEIRRMAVGESNGCEIDLQKVIDLIVAAETKFAQVADFTKELESNMGEES